MKGAPAENNDILLTVDGLGKTFGGITALAGYSLELPRGQLAGLIGPNGAGKTTAFNLLSGVIKPTTGKIFFEGADITGLHPHRKAALGITRTFQNIRLFENLSVFDNIRIALHMRHGRGPFETILHLPTYAGAEREISRRADEMLHLLNIAESRHEHAGNLSYGDQRRVEIARALATEPKLLLLDEPAAGLNPHETDDLLQLIQQIQRAYGLTILLVEHDMKVIMSVCRRIQVLDQGSLIAEGSPDEIKKNPRVVEAYLGSGSADGAKDHA